MDADKIIEELEKTTSINIPMNTEDYVDGEGLLVCGKCNTRKQCIIDFNGKIRKPMCLCKCEEERLEREKEEEKRRDRMIRIQEMRKTGFPDSHLQNWTFENDDKSNIRITTIAKKYVENFEEMKKLKRGLIFYGSVGTGKTYISACIANALIDKGYPCMATSLMRIVNNLTGMFEGKQNYVDSLNDFDLLVIDDMASERDTEYVNEIIMNVIDSRYRAGKPLIITTNLTKEQLLNPTDIKKQRVYSRILEMCIPIHVDGNDRRRSRPKKETDKVSELLGI